MEVGKIRWLGHLGFEIKLNNKTILIDLWLSENPNCSFSVEALLF
jgi:L-ascorbate metabolism protein UlaG (beta-lactamase superfamily)